MSKRALKLMETKDVQLNTNVQNLNDRWAVILPPAIVDLIQAGVQVRSITLPFNCSRCHEPIKLVNEFKEHNAVSCERRGLKLDKKEIKKKKKHEMMNSKRH